MSPISESAIVTLTSNLTIFDAWDGHINSTSIELFQGIGTSWKVVDASIPSFLLELTSPAPFDITIDYTTTNTSTPSGSQTVSAGDTQSSVISFIPDSISIPFSLTSAAVILTNGDDLFGTTYQSDSTYCNADDSFTVSILAALSGVGHCSFITASNLADLTGIVSLAANKQIAAIDPTIIQALSGATNLTLASNELTQIPDAAFENLADLSILSLNDNAIESIAVDAFTGSSLSQLYLSNNQLTTLPKNLLSGVLEPEKIAIFDISGNPLTNSQHMKLMMRMVGKSLEHSGKKRLVVLAIGCALTMPYQRL